MPEKGEKSNDKDIGMLNLRGVLTFLNVVKVRLILIILITFRFDFSSSLILCGGVRHLISQRLELG